MVHEFPVELREKVANLKEELNRACAPGSSADEQKRAAKSMLSVYTHVARLDGTWADLV